MTYLIRISIIIIIFYSNVVISKTTSNKILFNLNNKVFTKIDLENRIKYIRIGNDLNSKEIDNDELKEILDDYVSSLVFFEYYIEERIKIKNLNEEVENLFKENISSKLKDSNYGNQEISNLKKNLEIDVVRRKIIEKFLNSEKKLTKQTNLLDLIYNYNLSYININEKDIIGMNLSNIKNREDFNNFKIRLEDNNINFLYKSDDINESYIISELIKNIINNNQKIYFERKDGFIILISLEKNLESYEGIFVKLTNFNSTNSIDESDLNCNNINKLTNIKKKNYKEYEYIKLNEQVKNNLKSINDYMVYKNENVYNYIFLCELNYNEKLLNTINFNKKVDWFANKIQINFLTKYKNEYNYQKSE